MSIITAIFQAIGQALTFILPISESGHSAIFHDFASRSSGACSELTGLVHIGIAIGLVIAFYKVFKRLIFEFIGGWADVFSKKLDIKNSSNARRFMYYTLIPYVFMLFYLIPAGKKGNVYQFLKATSVDGNLISEGVCFIITALLLMGAVLKLAKGEKGMPLSILPVLILSLAIFITLPLAGLSLSAVIISLAIICNVNKNGAFRFFISISVPVLIVSGIVEIVHCVTYVDIVAGIIAVVLSAAAAFFISRVLQWLVYTAKIRYLAFYDFAIGIIAVIAGIVEIIIK